MENGKEIHCSWYGFELPPMDSVKTFYAGDYRIWEACHWVDVAIRKEDEAFQLLARWYWNEAMKRAIRRGSGTVAFGDLPFSLEAEARLTEAYRS